ncbi:NAD(P)H-dependent oxidoreductase [Flagellimonas halotolerans]|uniref:NAD(P)H-dependent oxidoreductase n=1 Tax=Flagellimonas halotolerans TaxID=3112164 RepID=A0ABU6IMN7_9FLAO|nr:MULTISPECIES: NAD(P)H-dependent oxidoreductase [unclassified Allomuricauda]MEC3964498.1 NAD(P)H-dependent oxidoreductase [Muricauda sp. SYSU M86414]MEC4264367.1 NAD(P)H-dependent oxidoreductase [Muricauda sp. SYSU M84420]
MAAILAFAGSNSSTSINFKLVKLTTALVQNHDIQTLDMAEHPFPVFSEDLEKEEGYSASLKELKEQINSASGLILSVNEHNGNPSAYFKNVLDWLSRMDRKFLEGTKVLLMSTSGGKRGGKGSLTVVENMLPRFGAEIVAIFSLPSFYDKFSEEGILDETLKNEHQNALNTFLDALKQ